MWFFKIFLKLNSWGKRGLCSYSVSRISSVELQFFIRQLRLERPLLHFFRAALKSLNLAVILVALLVAETLEFHTEFTISKKPGCSTQKFSNLKAWALGIEVPIWILQGMWSEVGLAIGRSKVLGKSLVQLVLSNTSNRLSRFQRDAHGHRHASRALRGTRWHVEGSRPSGCFSAYAREASS